VLSDNGRTTVRLLFSAVAFYDLWCEKYVERRVQPGHADHGHNKYVMEQSGSIWLCS
jgi:hypothetical protein